MPHPQTAFLLIDKPVGPTSHDVVDAVRHTLKGVKVGHTGTLDPLASGLLIIGVGQATKLLGKFVGLDKTYTFTVALGATTATDDAEAPIIKNPNPQIPIPNNDEVKNILKKFIGEQEQVPPAYSAKKQDGQRLYKIARSGGQVDVKPRRITIYELRLARYQYPQLDLTVRCSSGTYVRALARDIGRVLGVGGYVSSLRRTAIGPFNVSEATTLEAVRDNPTPHLLEAAAMLNRL